MHHPDWHFDPRTRTLASSSSSSSHLALAYTLANLPEGDLQVKQLITTPDGRILLFVCSRAVHLIFLPLYPSTTTTTSSTSTTAQAKKKKLVSHSLTHLLDFPPTTTHNNTTTPSTIDIVHALLHPLAPSTHLLILTQDGLLRIYNFGDLLSSITPSTSVHSGMQGIRPESIYAFSPLDSRTGYSTHAIDTDFVSFSFGSSASPTHHHHHHHHHYHQQRKIGWECMTVYALTTSGMVYSLCPVLPHVFCLPRLHLEQWARHLQQHIHDSKLQHQNTTMPVLDRQLEFLSDLMGSATPLLTSTLNALEWVTLRFPHLGNARPTLPRSRGLLRPRQAPPSLSPAHHNTPLSSSETVTQKWQVCPRGPYWMTPSSHTESLHPIPDALGLIVRHFTLDLPHPSSTPPASGTAIKQQTTHPNDPHQHAEEDELLGVDVMFVVYEGGYVDFGVLVHSCEGGYWQSSLPLTRTQHDGDDDDDEASMETSLVLLETIQLDCADGGHGRTWKLVPDPTSDTRIMVLAQSASVWSLDITSHVTDFLHLFAQCSLSTWGPATLACTDSLGVSGGSGPSEVAEGEEGRMVEVLVGKWYADPKPCLDARLVFDAASDSSSGKRDGAQRDQVVDVAVSVDRKAGVETAVVHVCLDSGHVYAVSLPTKLSFDVDVSESEVQHGTATRSELSLGGSTGPGEEPVSLLAEHPLEDALPFVQRERKADGRVRVTLHPIIQHASSAQSISSHPQAPLDQQQHQQYPNQLTQEAYEGMCHKMMNVRTDMASVMKAFEAVKLRVDLISTEYDRVSRELDVMAGASRTSPSVSNDVKVGVRQSLVELAATNQRLAQRIDRMEQTQKRLLERSEIMLGMVMELVQPALTPSEVKWMDEVDKFRARMKYLSKRVSGLKDVYAEVKKRFDVRTTSGSGIGMDSSVGRSRGSGLATGSGGVSGGGGGVSTPGSRQVEQVLDACRQEGDFIQRTRNLIVQLEQKLNLLE